MKVYRYTIPMNVLRVHQDPQRQVNLVYVPKKIKRKVVEWTPEMRADLIRQAQAQQRNRTKPSYRQRHKHNGPKRRALRPTG